MRKLHLSQDLSLSLEHESAVYKKNTKGKCAVNVVKVRSAGAIHLSTPDEIKSLSLFSRDRSSRAVNKFYYFDTNRQYKKPFSWRQSGNRRTYIFNAIKLFAGSFYILFI